MGNFAVELRVLGDDNVVTINPKTYEITTKRPLITGSQLVLRVVTGDTAAFAFITNKSKAVFPLRRIDRGVRTSYKIKLAPVRPWEIVPTFYYPDNRLSVATIEGAKIVLHHFAVVNHDNRLFLARSVRSETLTRCADGSVFAPAMPWEELFSAIGGRFDLSAIPNTVTEPALRDLSHLGNNAALVDWYDPTWGRGVAILDNDEAVLIFKDEIFVPDRELPYLLDGEIITFGYMNELRFPTESFTYRLCHATLRKPALVG